jgi:hypothetical protein
MFAAIVIAFFAFALSAAAFGTSVGIVVGGLALAACGIVAAYTDLFV